MLRPKPSVIEDSSPVQIAQGDVIAVGLLDAGQSSGFIIGLDYPVRLSVTPAGSILRQGIIGFPCWHPDRGRVVERELLPFWPVQDNHVLTVLRGVDLDAHE